MPNTAPAIQHLAERKCKITGRIHRIDGIQPVKNGFRQQFMIHIPEQVDTMTGRVIRREAYYNVEIFSNNQTDSRFLGAKNLRELVCCSVYLNSFHWISPTDGLLCGMRLNFIEWLKTEK